MPRDITSGVLDALSLPLMPAFFVSLTFSDETVNIWTGLGSITFNSITFQGFHGHFGLSVFEDASTLEAKGITVTFSAIDPTMLAQGLSYIVQGLPVTVYLGFFDITSGSLIDAPAIAWQGCIDEPTLDLDPTGPTLAINAESRLIDMGLSPYLRYTTECIQQFTPGDLACVFVDSLAQRNFFWGTAITTHNL